MSEIKKWLEFPPLSSKRFAIISVLFVCLFLQLISMIPAINLYGFGIYPRDFDGLLGIFSSPFVHGDWTHLVSNLVPFTILGILLCQYSVARFWTVFIFVAIVGGLLVWLFGRESYHIGLSGVIYGLWGFLICYGIMSRSIKGIIISLVVILLYSGFIWGVLPQSAYISFEGHLFGAIAGVIIGAYLGKEDRKKLKV